MKRILLAGVTALALAGPARAAIPVTEPTLDSQGWETLANWETELKSWTQQLTAMQQQLQTLLGVYNGIAHAPLTDPLILRRELLS